MDIYATKQGTLITVYSLVDYSIKSRWISKKRESCGRGKIKKFSKNSKKRLGRFLAKIKRNKLLFATLTFKENIKDENKAKQKLENFSKELSRKNKKIWYIWKMEYQKRGAIHFHLIVGGSDYKRFKRLLKKYWKNGFTAVNTLKEEHYYYFSKYIQKENQENNNNDEEYSPGRFWGIYNKLAIAISEIEFYNLNETLKNFFREVIFNRKQNQYNSTITIFT